MSDAQKYIGGTYQLPDEAEEGNAATQKDGKKHKHTKGKRLAVTSLLRSEPAAAAEAPGADAAAEDDAELKDESVNAEDAPTLAAVEPQGLFAVQHYPLYIARRLVRWTANVKLPPMSAASRRLSAMPSQ